MSKYVFWTTAVAFALGGLVGCQKTTVEGKDGKKLTITKPNNQSIKQGSTDSFDVSIERKNFRDPVKIKVESLPSGVTVQDKDMEIAPDKTSAKFTLKADDTAKVLEGQEVSITATAPEGLSATEHFKLNVKEKDKK